MAVPDAPLLVKLHVLGVDAVEEDVPMAEGGNVRERKSGHWNGFMLLSRGSSS
jgi:hypothetical protein